MTFPRIPAVLLALFVGAGVALVPTGLADACGGFFARKIEGARRPSLSYEKTLVIFDQEKRREHFVREVVFRAAGERFGFVVPTPARPEVMSMRSPFEGLERQFPFEANEPVRPGSRGGGGLRSASKSPGVTVLEVKKVGSFTSFVLAADDPQALSAWLAKNGLVSTPEADRWLSHYVRMKFFYVAMRYDPPDGEAASESTRAETVRLSFDTPVAYYPYFEPDPPAGKTPEGPRMLELWLASSDEKVPLAARIRDGEVSWVRPMEGGRRFSTNAQELLQKGFGPAFSLLPKGPVYIQRFIDQKRSRVGYGDILFVPVTPTSTSTEALRPLLPILDPTLDEMPADAGAKP